jgi:hypothetical protein
MLRPEIDIREAGGWAQYPREVHDYDFAASLENGSLKSEKGQKRHCLESPAKPVHQCRKQNLQRHFPGLARRLQAEVREAAGATSKPRQADFAHSSRPTYCGSSTTKELSFGTGEYYRARINI